MCKLYFLTSDPTSYTCPWCQRGEKGESLAEIEHGSGNVIMDTPIIVQEEV